MKPAPSKTTGKSQKQSFFTDFFRRIRAIRSNGGKRYRIVTGCGGEGSAFAASLNQAPTWAIQSLRL